VTRRALVAMIAAAACRTPAPAPPAHVDRPPAVVAAVKHAPRDAAGHAPPADQPAVIADASIAEIVGGWHGVDDDTWQYDLDVETDATFTQVVHPASGVDCQQTGTIAAGDGEFLRTFRDNECNHDYDGKTVHDKVITIDRGHLVLKMESDYLIRYDRAP
jgi:hypothetical protein